MHQLELVREDDAQQPKTQLPKLDDKTLSVLVGLMAETILAVFRNRKEDVDER